MVRFCMGFLLEAQCVDRVCNLVFKRTVLFSFLIPALFIHAFATHAHAQMDLHAHLDMKPGMGPGIRGDFNSEIRSHRWTSRLSTKGNAQSLAHWKGPGIFVLALYAHPYLSFFEVPDASLLHFDGDENVRQALDIEYQQFQSFLRTHSNHFALARDAKAARALIREGKVAVLLSIEGANAALETEADFKKWIDDRGVSIVTPFHLTEDHFGGNALIQTPLAWLNSFPDFMRSVWLTGGTCLKTFCRSTIGIKPDGRILIERLMARKVWIDVAHSSEVEITEMTAEFAKHNLPLLVTHTNLRDLYRAERGLGDLELDYISKHDGMVGLLPSQDLLKVPSTSSGLQTFQAEVFSLSQKLGAEKVSLGSDVNAPISGLSPLQNPNQKSSPLEIDGYYSYEQWTDLEAYVSPNPEWLEQSRQHFLSLWAHIRE
jgi:microsomal dipeptidase-like Zn-dependent dipeptidase